MLMNKRTAVAIAAALVLAGTAATPTFASTPSNSGKVTPPPSGQTATYSWTGIIPGAANANSDCNRSASDLLNDHHRVTLSVPRTFYRKHTLLATWTITPNPGVDDIILTVNKGAAELGTADNGAFGSAEVLGATNPASATYDSLACAFAGGPQPYTGTLTLQTDPPGAIPGGTSTGVAPASYQNYQAPAGVGDDAGEPSIGVNWNTDLANGGTAMYQAGLETLRVNFNDSTTPGTATWQDVTAPNTGLVSLDPILDTDNVHGRTFVSQLTGVDSLASFTDNDGASWTPSQGGGIPSGVDHQSIGNGPYPVGSPVGPLTSYPNAVYYCSQDLATAFCARSDNGGLTFGAGVPIYTTECGGIHGHVRVSPDGTVYVPNKSCSGRQGVAVSTDAGLTWTVRTVPISSPGTTDPSVASGSDNTTYFGYVNGDGHPDIAVTTNRGQTFSRPVDVGAALGIQNAVFPEVIAGDGTRAAFGFLGTTTPGNFNDPTFGRSADGTTYTGGEWHLYIAITYDGGHSWTTVDATPKDPVQRGSICTTGTTCGSDRNLLDFNDITFDRFGRVLFGYADGCTGPCDTSTRVSDNSQTAKATIARQRGGAGLLAAFP